jgi:hypothetical protein
MKVIAEQEILNETYTELFALLDVINATEEYLMPLASNFSFVILPESFPLGYKAYPYLNYLSKSVIRGDQGELNVAGKAIASQWFGVLLSINSWNTTWINQAIAAKVERHVATKVNNTMGVDNLDSLLGNYTVFSDIDFLGNESNNFT